MHFQIMLLFIMEVYKVYNINFRVFVKMGDMDSIYIEHRLFLQTHV